MGFIYKILWKVNLELKIKKICFNIKKNDLQGTGDERIGNTYIQFLPPVQLIRSEALALDSVIHQSLPPVAGLCGLTWKPCRLNLLTKTAIIVPLPDCRPVSEYMMKCYRKQRRTYSVNYEQELPKSIYPKKNGSSLLLVIVGMHTTMSYYFRTCPTEWPKWNQMSPIKRNWTLGCSWWGRNWWQYHLTVCIWTLLRLHS